MKILPDGKKLVTLRDAADYITGLPKNESYLPEWEAKIDKLGSGVNRLATFRRRAYLS